MRKRVRSVYSLPFDQWTGYDIELAEELACSYAREDFWQFRKFVIPKLKDSWWQQDSATHLMQFWRDFKAGLRPRLVFMAPPQHGKSVQVRDFIAWCAGQDPDLKFMFTSYSNDLVLQTNLYLQRIFVSPLFRKCFPKTLTSLSSQSIDTKVKYKCNSDLIEFVDHVGSFYNTTVEGQINGMGLDIGVVDDPMKGRKEANSLTIRNSTWDWFTDDFFARFSDTAGMIMILTRWHVDDPAGRWLERFPDTKVIKYKAIATEDEKFRKKGEALFPEHKTLEFLYERKKLMTASSFESLFQQSPYIVGGGLFSPEDFHITNAVDRSNIVKSIRYWDKAGTEDDGAHTAGVLMHVMKDNTYLIENVVRGQWSALERENRILHQARIDKTATPHYSVWIEQEPGSSGKESAEATIRNLKGFRVYADKVTGDKEIRAEPFAAQVQGGSVSIREGSWNKVYLEELEQFPSGSAKDQVDASSGAFNKLVTSNYDPMMRWA